MGCPDAILVTSLCKVFNPKFMRADVIEESDLTWIKGITALSAATALVIVVSSKTIFLSETTCSITLLRKISDSISILLDEISYNSSNSNAIDEKKSAVVSVGELVASCKFFKANARIVIWFLFHKVHYKYRRLLIWQPDQYLKYL